MKIAVIGGGISGLAVAWLLHKKHQVTLFEAADYVGGHTHTVDVTVDGQTFPVDTGFLVFNHQTYPQLTALFNHLGIDTVASDMSFSVSLDSPAMAWAGTSLGTLFAQKSNLLRLGFWRMLKDILRFNQETKSILDAEISLNTYLLKNHYSNEFRDWYLLPMAAAIWSCPTATMLHYPLVSFVRFARNHGLLQIFNRPPWLTVRHGGREYVKRILESLTDVRIQTRVDVITPALKGNTLRWTKRDKDLTIVDEETFDEVIFACHSSQAKTILGQAATPDEIRLLSAIPYQPNKVYLHTDTQLLPKDPRVWASWNYLSGTADARHEVPNPVSVSYLLNRLQPLPVTTPIILSLNPAKLPDPQRVLGQFDYAHPMFDLSAIHAQSQLVALQGKHHRWYCGAWTGYGFHEDGLNSAIAVASKLGCHPPWQLKNTT